MGGWTIAWTNLAVLSGAFALGVPYLVHLLTRRTPSTMVFPTLQFLKRAQASQSAIFRLREAILLLLRTAFVALLLLAFLKPVLRAQAMDESVVRKQAAVILVDASLSMQYSASGVTPFVHAQRAVDQLLDRLGPDCVVNVVFAAASPAFSLEAPAPSVVPLKRDIQSAVPTLERADIDAALDGAVRQLEAFPEYTRTLYLVSDFQRTNWASAKFAAIPEGIKIVFLPVNDPAATNVAITEVSLRPRMPVLTEAVEVVCTVANYGPAPATVPLTLQLTRIGAEPAGASAPLKREVAIGAGASAAASFRLRATDIGSFEGTLKIPDDALSADNARYFTLEVRDQIDVAIVSDAVEEPRSGAHFVARALDPFGADLEARRAAAGTAMHTRIVRARDLDLPSNPPQVLVLDGTGPLGATTARQIAEYLANGGAAIYFLSDALDKSNIDAIASATQENFVTPFTLTNMVDIRARGGDKSAVLAEANFDDPLLRRFRENRDLTALRFYRYYGTERQQGRGQVFARYKDGNLALGRATLGAGALLLCNFSAGREASDLAQRPAFLPLLYEMIKNMRPREGAASNALVGYPASGSLSADANATGIAFADPSGNAIGASSERRGDRLAVIVQATHVPGFYRVREGARELGAIPVNVDARESDLMPLGEAQLAELAASPHRQLASAAGRDSRAIGTLLEGVPLWPHLLLAALCVLACEQMTLLYLRR